MKKTNLINSIRLLFCLTFLFILRTNLTAQITVELTYFAVSFYDYFPEVSWGTQSETNNAGWNIYRSENGNIQDSIQVNPILILGAGTTTEPTDYDYIDRYPVYPEQTYWYWLESISESGEIEIFGPITIVIPDDMPVVIVNFIADYYDDLVIIGWSTEFESSILGWKIYRSDNGNIEDMINISELIDGNNCPADYEFIDYDIELNQTYWYWLECIFFDGDTALFGPIFVFTGQLSIDEELLKSQINLYQNYPNPFNPATTISFSIPEESKVNLIVYNIKGQKVKELAASKFDKGNHSVIWNGIDESGKSVSSGIYFYKLSVNGKTEEVKKCLLLK